MKYLSILLCCTVCFGFRHTSQDMTFLYQSWSFMQLKYDKGGYISTYKSLKEIGNYDGFTFRKDGTLAVSHGVSVYPESIQQTYEVVEGF